MQVEETEFYRTRNGNVLGPFTHKPHIGWIVPGLRVSWDNDGRLRRSTIEEHPLDLIAPATIVEVKVPVASDPNSGKIGLKVDDVKISDPKKAEYEEFVRNNLKQIASMFGLPYSVLAANMSRAATAFTEFRARGEELQKALALLKPTAEYRIPAGPGISRKGWPQIGTVWRHKNGNQYEVTGYSNKEGTKIDYPKTVHYRNISNGEDYSRRLDRWMASMTFKNYPIQLSERLLDSTGDIPKRVFFDTLQNAFYRFSAHKNRHYRMPDEFYRAWSKRSGEFPRAYANLTAKLGDVRLTFPSLQAKRDVRPEDSKFTMSLSFPSTVSREQVERIRRQVDDTVLRRRAEMADTSIPEGVFFNKANGLFMNLNGETMPIDFYLRWIGRNHLFPATYEDAWDAIAGPATEKKPKVNEALGEPYIPAAEQMRSYIAAGRWIDGKPLDTMKPGVRRFLEEIGATNALGDLIGVMQTNAYSLTAQYKRAGKAGVICVEVELPKAITVDVAR